jgi:hypothetical protein
MLLGRWRILSARSVHDGGARHEPHWRTVRLNASHSCGLYDRLWDFSGLMGRVHGGEAMIAVYAFAAFGAAIAALIVGVFLVGLTVIVLGMITDRPAARIDWDRVGGPLNG